MANLGHAQGCLILAALITCCISSSATAGGVLYVDSTAPPRGDGTSWRTAFRFLQDALTAAANPRRGVSEIRVAQGTFLPDRDEVTPNGSGDSTDSFALIDGIALRGGYVGLAGPDPDERDPDRFTSLLSGFILKSDPPPDSDCFSPHDGYGCDSAACMEIVCQQHAPYCCSPLLSWDLLCAQLAAIYCQQPPLPSPPVGSDHIMTATGVGRSTVLDGFTMSSQDTPPSNDPIDRFGRGMLLTDSSPTITRCRFTKNFVISEFPHHAGGGALAAFGGSPLITNCLFESNHAESHVPHDPSAYGESGGAIYALNSDLTVDQSTFHDNLARFGGSIIVTGGDLIVTKSTFRRTPGIDPFHSQIWGGAISHSSGELHIEDCRFDSLLGSEHGGAVACFTDHVSISGCVFRRNTADKGGAIWVADNADALVSDCRFSDNGDENTTLGGAVCARNLASVVLENCTFDGNATSTKPFHGWGGAIFGGESSTVTISDCMFSQNQSYYGGAAWLQEESDSTVQRCTFVNNVSPTFGGALFSYESTMTVSDCDFLGNAAGFAGAAVSGTEAALQLSSCRFIANGALGPFGPADFGGALYCEHDTTCQTNNCLFVANVASRQGGGAFFADGCTGGFAQCTLAFNVAGIACGGICVLNEASPSFPDPAPSHASVVNSILWNNTDPLGMIEPSQVAVLGPGKDALEINYSCVQGWTGSLGGAGNFGDDPLFLDPLGRDRLPGTGDEDLRLSSISPCIDTGDTSAVCGVILTDLDGEPRITDGDGNRIFIVDMGAYEAPGPALPASDLNCDGVIDTIDLGILLSGWSIPPESPGCGGSVPCAGDLNLDGVVNTLDLGILLAGWTL